jgi:hypothetical protein
VTGTSAKNLEALDEALFGVTAWLSPLKIYTLLAAAGTVGHYHEALGRDILKQAGLGKFKAFAGEDDGRAKEAEEATALADLEKDAVDDVALPQRMLLLAKVRDAQKDVEEEDAGEEDTVMDDASDNKESAVPAPDASAAATGTFAPTDIAATTPAETLTSAEPAASAESVTRADGTALEDAAAISELAELAAEAVAATVESAAIADVKTTSDAPSIEFVIEAPLVVSPTAGSTTVLVDDNPIDQLAAPPTA